MNAVYGQDRGFTLIELMVVISAISMLSSVVLVGTNNAKAAARDSTRVQQVRQIDIAVQSYALSNGHPPDLAGTCAASAGGSLNSSTVVNCTASSNAAPGTPQGQAWAKFIADLQPYGGSTIPGDPCASCTSSTGQSMGYTYISPAAVMYACAQSGTCSQVSTDPQQQYQLYAPLEKIAYYQGSGGGGGALYTPATQPVIGYSMPFWMNSPTRPRAWQIAVSISGQYQSCRVTDSSGSINMPINLPAIGANFMVSPPLNVTDVITTTCQNYGTSVSAQTSVQG